MNMDPKDLEKEELDDAENQIKLGDGYIEKSRKDIEKTIEAYRKALKILDILKETDLRASIFYRVAKQKLKIAEQKLNCWGRGSGE